MYLIKDDDTVGFKEKSALSISPTKFLELRTYNGYCHSGEEIDKFFETLMNLIENNKEEFSEEIFK